MKKKTVAVIAAVLVLALALCLFFALRKGGRDDSHESLRVGVAIYKGNDTFISNMYDEIVKAAAQYEQETGVRVYINMADAQENQSLQNEQIERFISLDYDALCVNLVDRTDAAAVIDMAREADVPVVFFNREPVAEDMGKWDRIIYVGTDARESAEQEAEIILEAYRENPRSIDLNGDGVIQYVMLEGESRHQDALIRTEVSVQCLRDSGLALERVDGGIANWIRSQAAALTETFFADHGDEIELIICNNDDMALGAADAVAKLGLDFTNIVGIDGTPQGLEAVEDGRLLGTVVMDYPEQAQAIFELARALAWREDIAAVAEVRSDNSVRIPMHFVRRES